MGIYTKIADEGGKWVEIGAGESGLPGLGGWATVQSITGSAGTRYTYNDGVMDWVAYEFTDDGTIAASPGLADVLIVGASATNFVGGAWVQGIKDLRSGGPITIGKRPSNGIDPAGAYVANTWIGDEALDNELHGVAGIMSGNFFGSKIVSQSVGAAAGWAYGVYAGVTSNITGSPVIHGHAANSTEVPAGSVSGYGCGRHGSTSGVAIVRVPANHALATIPNTWVDA